jgi:hypothetical protein
VFVSIAFKPLLNHWHFDHWQEGHDVYAKADTLIQPSGRTAGEHLAAGLVEHF